MALIDNAIELFKENKIDEARRVLEICFDVNNDDYLANRYLGLCHIELKNYDNALIFLKHALELSKNHESEGDLGVCYWHLKDYERAQIHLITSVMDKYEDKYAKELKSKMDALQKEKISALQGLEKDVKKAIDAEGKKGVYALILTSNNALYGTTDITNDIIKILNSGQIK